MQVGCRRPPMESPHYLSHGAWCKVAGFVHFWPRQPRASTRVSGDEEWIGEDIRPHRRAHLHGTHTPCLPLLPPAPVGCLGVPRPRRNAASARARQQAVVCTGIRGWHRVYVAPYAAEATAMQHKRTQHACTMTTPTNTICNKNNTLRRQWQSSETSRFTYSVHCSSGRIEVASGRRVFTTAVAWAQHICGSRAGEQQQQQQRS